ncbi:nucleic acid dioxygenase ALKBH1 [Nymphalis io]|uniref:nucleic acid dioxygenase ALKBH1 n=1 Tax=Inachis io TaxID=171585 RepID=UPI0021678C75|nr:nucleic acid dioxygenase ALKBH1 [Nymphalis io]
MKRNLDIKSEDNFMKRFKYYKSNKPEPSLDKVVRIQYNVPIEVNNISNIIEDDSRTKLLGLRNFTDWKTYTFNKHSGLFLIANPFTSLGQRLWIRKCLEDYPRKPNKTNIDIEKHIEDWWREIHKNDELDRKLQKKLRWTTLGYHHNWDTKVYCEKNRNVFPLELAELCDVVSQYLGYIHFKAQAAIVNYYHMGSTLSAHTDHSEVNLEAPLLSFSFGQSAIFLIGGQEKSYEPSAILLNSGDILVMSKEARLCYHAVPKILQASNQPWNNYEELIQIADNDVKTKYINDETFINEINRNADNKEWSQFSSYVEKSRINVNVRQVLMENQDRLDN